MPTQLVFAPERDERGHGDQTAIALREAGAFPHIAEDDFVGQLTELRKDVPHLADGGRGRSSCCHANLLRSGCERLYYAVHEHRATRIALRLGAPCRVARADD